MIPSSTSTPTGFKVITKMPSMQPNVDISTSTPTGLGFITRVPSMQPSSTSLLVTRVPSMNPTMRETNFSVPPSQNPTLEPTLYQSQSPSESFGPSIVPTMEPTTNNPTTVVFETTLDINVGAGCKISTIWTAFIFYYFFSMFLFCFVLD